MKFYYKDHLTTALWLILFLISFYFLPAIVSAVVSILFLFSFLIANRRNEYIYLSVLFIIISAPGGIFYGESDSVISLAGQNIALAEIFSLAAFVKILLLKRNQEIAFERSYWIYFTYLFILIVIGLAEGMYLSDTTGQGLGRYRATLTTLVLFPLYFSLPRILPNSDFARRFMKILFVYVLINFLFQIFHLWYGQPIGDLLATFEFDEESKYIIRPLYGYYLSFITLILSIFLFAIGEIRKKLFYIILFVSYASIFITATRGWMISYTVILVFSLIYIFRFNLLELGKIVLVVLLFVISLSQIHFIRSQFIKSYERLQTVSLILEGDLSAGGTLRRLTDRHEPVMEKFQERPIFGWGFSSEAHKTYDPHVGNQSIVMTGGIIGALIIIIFLGGITYKIVYYKIQMYQQSIIAKNLGIFVIGLIGLFIIHSSSTDLFGFLAPTAGQHYVKTVFLAIYFSLANAYVTDLKNSNSSKNQYG